MNDKRVCGSGYIQVTQYGYISKLSITKKELKRILLNNNTINDNDLIKFELIKRKTPNHIHDTHLLRIDQWSPLKHIRDNTTPQKKKHNPYASIKNISDIKKI